mmetsp:Transcript_14736/g.57797  ORF Transcript_14736/g.57797 Transcript_14736/m.57797 type:complete len:686 (+) Transcript_14736:34-2091(+)
MSDGRLSSYVTVYGLVKVVVLLGCCGIVFLSLLAPWYKISSGDTAYETTEYLQAYYVVTACTSSIGTCQQRYTMEAFRTSGEHAVMRAAYVVPWVLCLASVAFFLPSFCVRHFCVGSLLACLLLSVAVTCFAIMLPYATEATVEDCSSTDTGTICTTFWGSTDSTSWMPTAGWWLAIAGALLAGAAGFAELAHAIYSAKEQQRKTTSRSRTSSRSYDTFAPSNTSPPDRAPPRPPAEGLYDEGSGLEEGRHCAVDDVDDDDCLAIEFNPEDMEKARREKKQKDSFLKKALSPRATSTSMLEKKRYKRYLRYLELPANISGHECLLLCRDDGRALRQQHAAQLAHWCAKHGASSPFGLVCTRLLCAVAYPEELVPGVRQDVLATGAWKVLVELATKGVVKLHRTISEDSIEFQKELARGSGGKVFLATWRPPATLKCGGVLFLAQEPYQVAVKVCQEGGMPFTTREEFLFEAGIMSMLSHPNVLPCFGANEAEDQLFVVMPVAHHGSLLSLLTDFEGNPSPEIPMEQKLKWALEVAEAMEYLHKWNIVYRDLKACNILVDANKRCLLSDFGISRTVDRDKRMTLRQGTTAWMAPEMLTGTSDYGVYTQAVDVYSYGIFLFEVVAQCRPFVNVSMFSLPDRIVEGLRPDVPDNAVEPLRSLMQACWQPQAADRPSFKEIVATLKSAA